MFMRLMATVVGLVLAGATAQAAIVKNFEFNVDGVLPSADPQIGLFLAANSLTEAQAFSVSYGLLKQRTLAAVGNYSYSFPQASLTGGGLDPAQSLVMEARLRISGIQGVDGVFFQAFDGQNRYGPLFDSTGVVYFDAQRSGPSVAVSDIYKFHIYRVESPGGSSAFNFFIDNVLLYSGMAASQGTFNGFEWGDGLSTANNGADVDWDYVRFAQPSVAAVPIPAALPLFLTALAGLGFMGWSKRRAV